MPKKTHNARRRLAWFELQEPTDELKGSLKAIRRLIRLLAAILIALGVRTAAAPLIVVQFG